MDLNPNYPERPMDPDSPGSPAMPNEPGGAPRGSDPNLPIPGTPIGGPSPIQDEPYLVEDVVTGPPASEDETRIDTARPPEELDKAQEPEEFSDAWITLKVKAALAVHPKVSALSTEVVTNHGVVTLSGTAGSWTEHEEVTAVAQGIKGVKRVDNRVQVSERS